MIVCVQVSGGIKNGAARKETDPDFRRRALVFAYKSSFDVPRRLHALNL